MTDHANDPLSTAERYTISVFEVFPDVDDVPVVDGIIRLTYDEKRDLEARLERMSEAGHCGGWSIERFDDPAEFSAEGVYNFITGDIDHTDTDLRAVWDGTDV